MSRSPDILQLKPAASILAQPRWLEEYPLAPTYVVIIVAL